MPQTHGGAPAPTYMLDHEVQFFRISTSHRIVTLLFSCVPDLKTICGHLFHRLPITPRVWVALLTTSRVMRKAWYSVYRQSYTACKTVGIPTIAHHCISYAPCFSSFFPAFGTCSRTCNAHGICAFFGLENNVSWQLTSAHQPDVE